VWGKADRIVALDHAKEFTRRIAGAGAELIDNSGDLPHIE
jgi:hypothetical protein